MFNPDVSGDLLFAQEVRPLWIQKGDAYEETKGRGISIKTNPKDARVFIDGIERGTTPLSLEYLRPGNYFLHIVKEGYKERYLRVRVYPGTLLDITLELEESTGQVLVLVDTVSGGPGPDQLPLDPRLTVDGVDAAGLNLTLRTGWRNIMVRAFGWEEEACSVFVMEDSVQYLSVLLRPAVFRVSSTGLSRTRFNPSNAGTLGTTDISFTVSSPGQGTLEIRNSHGELVFTTALGPFRSWFHSVQWNGRDEQGLPLPDDTYSCTLAVKSIPWDESLPLEEIHTLSVVIDSSQVIRPLTLSPGKSGLLFVPVPDLLPPGAFQVEGNLLFGAPPVAWTAWTSLPFTAAFRFSPLEFLELAAVIDVLPVFNQDAALGLGGAVKWTIINPAKQRLHHEPALGLALNAVFSWLDNRSVSSFGMGSGIEVNLPFSVEYRGVSFHLAPALLWTGDQGFPWEGMPRLLVSGGLAYNGTGFLAGLSARSEFRYMTAQAGFSNLTMLGGEIKLFPPPSNFVFSLLGGIWMKNSGLGQTPLGGFGGAGIGIIY